MYVHISCCCSLYTLIYSLLASLYPERYSAGTVDIMHLLFTGCDSMVFSSFIYSILWDDYAAFL